MSYKAVFHIDLENHQLFNLALNNIANTFDALEEEKTDFILLANGPGVAMLGGDIVFEYLEHIKMLMAKGVRFQVCNKALEKFEISKEELGPGVEVIPAGIVGLIDLQNDGFSYIKP